MRYPYPEVLDEIPLEGHAVIEASAGTGKTYTIEHLVVDRLLRTNARLEQLLVVTFTDKATSELRKRIRDLIEQVLKRAEAHDALVKSGEVEPTDPHDPNPPPNTWLIDAEARRTLERALFSFDRAAIFTIHAFCRKVLVELAFDSGQLFEQSLVDSRRTFQGAWRLALREQLSTQPELKRSVEQWLHYNNGDLKRLEDLLYRAHSAGYLELTRPFQLELTQTLERLIEAWDYKLMCEAYEESALVKDALALALERLGQVNLILSERLALHEKASFLNKLDLSALIKPRRSSSKLKKRFPDELPEQAQRFLFQLTQLELLTEMEGAIERHVVEGLLPTISATLTERKRRAGEVDYDDLLRCVWRALMSPQGPSLATTLRERFRYALIDEFQDTDPLQWKIFKRVFVDSPSSAHGLYIIGDPKQAIYTFRGADVHTYLQARLELTQVGAPRVLLKRNYRSSPALVDGVNHLLDQQGKAPIFQGAITYDEPVECGREALRVCDASGRDLAPITLWRHKPPPPSKGKARVAIKPLKARFASEIARHIYGVLREPERALWIEEGEVGAEGYTRRQVKASDILILVRDNREAFEISEAMRELEIPFTLYKPEGLLQGHEAREVYALLKAIVDPHHRGARLGAFTTPFFGVPWREVYHYNALPPGHPRLERLLEWHQLAVQGRYGALFYQLLHHSGLAERELFFAESERELTNYQHIFEILLSVTSQHKCTPRELLTLLGRYVQGLESPPGSEDNIHRLYSDRHMVQVMTIHKSKGLEAPIIYLFGGFGSPPEQLVNIVHDEQLGRRVLVGATARKAVAERLKREQSQEDQRLLYVALTRAQVKLYLPFVDTSRPLNGTYQPLKERLRAMHEEGFAGLEREIELEELDEERPTAPHPSSHKALDEWSPPEELFELPQLQEEQRAILSAHKPLVVTSYTRMKQVSGVHSLTSRGEAPHDAQTLTSEGSERAEGAEGGAVMSDGMSEVTRELLELDLSERELMVGLGERSARVAHMTHEVEVSTEDHEGEEREELPGGKEMGRCLHEVIEEAPMSALTRAKSPEAWGERPEVRLVFDEVMRRHNIDARWRERLMELVFYTLKSPLKLTQVNISNTERSREQVKLPALSRLPHLIEMEFLYPVPERHHPALLELKQAREGYADLYGSSRARWGVERGFVKGFIDFLCEHKGKMYVVDWKSDLCLSYEGEALTRHVEQHYTLQAQLYTLGVVRWLKISDEADYEARFGGTMYVFLRAFHAQRAGDEGVYFNRPSWAEVQRYERLLGEVALA